MTMQPYGEAGSLSFGQSHLDAGDLVPPRVKVVQQMAQEAADKKAQPGDFFNTLTGENYGSELSFIPIQPFKQRILLMREERRALIESKLGFPIEGSGLACRSYDMEMGTGSPGGSCAACPLAEWDGSQPPLCSETYNVAALNAENGDLIILGFQKSSAKVGKRLFSMLRLTNEAPWARVYHAKTRAEKNDKGNFFVPDITKSTDTPAPELLKVAANWATQLSGVRIEVDAEMPIEEAGGQAPF